MRLHPALSSAFRPPVWIALGVAVALSPRALAQTPAPTHASAPATVQSITRTPLPRGDRITIELSREVTYKTDRLPTPDRVFFDLATSVVTRQTSAHAQAMTGTFLKTLRVGQHTDTSMRVVLELTGAPRYSVFTMYNPYRLVIDLERPATPDAPDAVVKAAGPAADLPPHVTPPPVVSGGAPDALAAPADAPPAAAVAAVAAAAPAPSAPHADDRATVTPPVAPAGPGALGARTTAGLPSILASSKAVIIPAPPSNLSHGDYSLGRQLGLGVSRIVIDPGHGGHDPGAQGNGIDESELVLDVALRLEALLKDQPGVEVVLTRRTDDFIPLEERTAIANRENADLFLSIHANAMKDATVRGVETYFLNFATTPTAEALAARENATSGKTMGALPEIVKAITLNNKIEESRELAGVVQDSLTRELKSQGKVVRDLGVKQAPFVVLIGAQMPSVLAEISFVTNRTDATLLKQSAYRQSIAQALCDSVLKYQGGLKRTVTLGSKAKDSSR